MLLMSPYLEIFVLFEVLGPSVEEGGADVEMKDGETVGFAPISVPKANSAMKRHLTHQQVVHPSDWSGEKGGGRVEE